MTRSKISASERNVTLAPTRFGIAYLHSDLPSLSDVVEDLLSRRIIAFAFCRCFFRKPTWPLGDIGLEIHDLQEKYAALQLNSFLLSAKTLVSSGYSGKWFASAHSRN